MTPALSPDALAFLVERHLATLTTPRRDGTPHVTPVGFTWDAERGLARVICDGGSVKARNLRDGGRVALCSFERARWLTLEGDACVSDDPDEVAEGVRRYAERYRQPRVNPNRVVLLVTVDRVLSSRSLRAT